VSPETKRHIDV